MMDCDLEEPEDLVAIAEMLEEEYQEQLEERFIQRLERLQEDEDARRTLDPKITQDIDRCCQTGF